MNAAKLKPESKSDALFLRADEKWRRGDLRSAFRLFVAAAQAGDRGAQLNAGYFYDVGLGVRQNRAAALYWYKRAYRRGCASAATNIGTIWRDQNSPRRALAWFKQAAKLGDDSSHLEIAKICLREDKTARALGHLKKVLRSNCVTQGELESAKRMLRKVEKLNKNGRGR